MCDSGSSGGGGSRFDFSSTGGSAVGGGDRCAALAFQTVLNSPQPAIVAQLSVGIVLDVDAVQVRPGQYRVEAKYNGNLAGTITSINMMDLINCIQGGHRYKAIVVSPPTGGVVTVSVKAR